MESNYQRQFDFLRNGFKSGNLAHAYLLSGQDIGAIEDFVKEFVSYINCLAQDVEKDKKGVCGVCVNCKMIQGRSFPDFLFVRSQDSDSSQKNEKDMMEISIEQIRDVQNFLSLKSYYGSFKSVIIENAERMSQEAQNCFLKTLEEPRGETLIFLVSSRPDLMLSTIFSRCQQLKFSDNRGSMQIEDKLSADIRKVLSMDLAEKFSFAKSINLDGVNFGKLLEALQVYFRQEMLNAIGFWGKAESKYSIEKIKKIIRLIDKIGYQSSIYNINQRLALEVILIEV